MSEMQETVWIVDDDDGMRESLVFLLRSVGLEVEAFAGAQEMLRCLAQAGPESCGCVLTDVRMPEMSGLALQEKLAEGGRRIPVIVMTAYGDVPMAVRAMRSGAFNFLEKPFNDQDLVEQIQAALAFRRRRSEEMSLSQETAELMESLTPRESEVLELVVAGRLNKQIAARLGVSVKTVESHRAKMMEKLQVPSLAELVRRVTLTRMQAPSPPLSGST